MASRLNGGDPIAAWAQGQGRSSGRRAAGACRAAAARGARRPSSERQRIITIPEGAPVEVAPTPRVLSLDVRQHVDARSVRGAGRCARTTTSPTSIRRGRRSARTNTCATSTTARCGRSRFTRCSRAFPALPAPAPGRVEAAQVDPVLLDGVRRRLGALLRADDDRGGSARTITRVKLGQLAESLIRLCRLIVGIRLHCEDCRSSRASGCSARRRSWRRPAPAARRSAGRSIPAYVLYTAGKLMVLKLREDYKAQAGRHTHCAGFTTRCSRNGTVPLWLHRALMLGCAKRRHARIGRIHAPLRISMRGNAVTASRRFRSSPTLRRRRARSAGRAGRQAAVLARHPVQGTGWYITDYAKKSGTDAGKTGSGEKSDGGSSSSASESKADSKSDSAGRRIPAPLRRRHRRQLPPRPRPRTPKSN